MCSECSVLVPNVTISMVNYTNPNPWREIISLYSTLVVWREEVRNGDKSFYPQFQQTTASVILPQVSGATNEKVFENGKKL